MSILNRLRTGYVHLPGPVRRVVSPALAMLPVRYRYGRTYGEYRGYIARAKSDPAFVAAWQEERLRTVLQAASRTRHYSAVFHKLGLTERDLANFRVGDLSCLPVLTKDELREDPRAFLAVPESSLDQVSTSGSSGKPLSFFLDKDRSAREWAFLLDAWSQVGLADGERRAVLRGIHLDHVDRRPWEYEPALGELRLSPFHLTDHWMGKYCDAILNYRARYLHGYPSAIAIFANFIAREGRDDVREVIKGIIFSSESLHAHQLDAIAGTFPNARAVSFYGMSEKVLFGVSLPGQIDHFALNPLYGIPELLDDDGYPVTQAGRTGRVVGTGLLFAGAPLLRYETGDVAECAGDAAALALRNISSRWGREFLVGADNRLISMTAINVHSPAYSTMRAFQFFQEQPGRALLKVVLASGRTLDDVAPFVREISQKVGSSIAFETVEVDAVAQNQRGKIKFIDQKIDIGRIA